MSKPVLKWAGGKTIILDEIQHRINKISNKNGVFFDVFCGAGSVSLEFSKLFSNTIMNDTNVELYNVFLAIKNEPSKLMEALDKHSIKHSHDYYYEIRELDRKKNYTKTSYIDRAARMIYLNKTCYNGLFRVNSKGYFNVPIGRQKKYKIYDKDNIMSVHETLKKIDIKNKDFSVVIKECKPGDIVYFDPPYDKINSSSFIAYNANHFDLFDQERLKVEIDELTKKGVYVIASNSYTDNTAELYKEYLNESSYVYVKRSIASKSSSRAPIKEILIDNIRMVENNVNKNK